MTPVKMAMLLGFHLEAGVGMGYVMHDPRGTVKVTADVMTRCRSVQRKAVLHVRAIQ